MNVKIHYVEVEQTESLANPGGSRVFNNYDENDSSCRSCKLSGARLINTYVCVCV